MTLAARASLTEALPLDDTHLVCRLHVDQCMLERCPSVLEHLAVVPSDVPLVNVQAIFRHGAFPLEPGNVNKRLQLLDIRRPAYLRS